MMVMMSTKTKVSAVAAATAALLLAGSVRGSKDSVYYRAGMGNPNVDLKMYWADARNVLEDLDQFSALYIQYHNCAWSQNRLYYGDGDQGSADESDYWYIGATPDFAANVAYSLYGVLKGDSAPSGSACGSSTFINSFTTSAGFEVFANALYTSGATSTDYSNSYSSKCGGGKGVACDYNVGFASVTYSTSTCNPKYAKTTTDSMAYMNSVFQKAQCVRIYQSSTSYYSSNNNNNNANGYSNSNYQYGGGNNGNGNRGLQRDQELAIQDSGLHGLDIEPLEIVPLEGESSSSSLEVSDGTVDRELNNNNNAYGYGYNNYYYAYSGTPLALLYYSNACFIQNFWAPNGGCPDPYGRLQYYQQNFNRGVRHSLKVDPYVKYRANMEKGKQLITTGAGLFMAAFLLYLIEQLIAFRKRMRGTGSQKAVAHASSDPTIPSAGDGPSKAGRTSVVGLVRSATKKVAASVAGAAAATAAIVRSRSKMDGSTDGIMKSDGSIKDIHFNNDDTGSYAAPAAMSAMTTSFTNSFRTAPKPAPEDDVAADTGDVVPPEQSVANGSVISTPAARPIFIDAGAPVPNVTGGETTVEQQRPQPPRTSSQTLDDDQYKVSAVEAERQKANGVRGLFGKMKSKVLP
jgi:hypothetical protein